MHLPHGLKTGIFSDSRGFDRLSYLQQAEIARADTSNSASLQSSLHVYKLNVINCPMALFFHIFSSFFHQILRFTFRPKASTTMWTSGACLVWSSSRFVSGWSQVLVMMEQFWVTLYQDNTMNCSSLIIRTLICTSVDRAGLSCF